MGVYRNSKTLQKRGGAGRVPTGGIVH